jgi:hypothetical protein
MPTNPTPRAALAKAEGGVARPALRRRTGPATVPPVSTIPLPTPTDVVFGPLAPEPETAVHKDPSSHKEPPAHKEPSSHKESPSHKEKGKKGHKSDHAPAEIVVSLSKPVRRALKAAAADRGTTPEALAALVLTAWLER